VNGHAFEAGLPWIEPTCNTLTGAVWQFGNDIPVRSPTSARTANTARCCSGLIQQDLAASAYSAGLP
jgi:hypothetical protein